jgi:hypothetical protein
MADVHMWQMCTSAIVGQAFDHHSQLPGDSETQLPKYKANTYFKEQQKKKDKTVTTYKRALETTVYPELKEWAEGLLDNLEYKIPKSEKEEKLQEKV